MTMTRKHFELVAEAIRVERPSTAEHHNWPNRPWYEDKALDRVAENLAAQFTIINPRFDKARFMEATRRDKSPGN